MSGHWLSEPRVLPPLLRGIPWRAVYGRWSDVSESALGDGYTLLLPVPGDLPVFVRLAVANTLAQSPEGRVETLLIPDIATPASIATFQACQVEFEGSDLRLVKIPHPGPVMRRLSRSGNNNHFLQIEAGVRETGTKHALLHDADLFFTDPRFLARHYARCAEEGYACLGVSPAWDDWLREHGFDHVVATWELMFDVRWMREFAPWEHRQQVAWVDGAWHGFDTTLLPQVRTAPERCAIHPSGDRYVHFNWVICVYRMFQRSNGPFEDDRFVLLLIRLLVDALEHAVPGADEVPLDVPAVDVLAGGLTDPHARVTYLTARAAEEYVEFSRKVRLLLRGPLFDDRAVESVEAGLRAFDAAFG